MPRTALLIANSVTAQHTQEKTGTAFIRRTTEQISATLAGLPGDCSFGTTCIIDQQPDKVRHAVDRAAQKAAADGSLLLIYYFGHGRLDQDDLAFVHPGKKKREATMHLPFQSLLHQVQVHSPAKVLFILDCCYAGAAARQFGTSGNEYCLLACTTPTTRAIFESEKGRPMGVFTRALIDGLTSPDATVSITNDDITPGSLFRYAKKETERLTSGSQQPYFRGHLDDPLTTWTEAPLIAPGMSSVPIKSGYAKVLAILTALRMRKFGDIKQLYQVVLARNRETFLTPFKDDEGRIVERPAHWTSLRRYISFLRAIGALDPDELELTISGVDLIEDAEIGYNAKLLAVLENYLSGQRLSREVIRQTMQDLLQRRSMPTMRNIVTDLELSTRHRVNQSHLGLTLQFFGHMAAIAMPKSREQIFFPWASRSRRSSA